MTLRLWPSIEEERTMSGPWRRLSIISQIVLFGLTVLAIAALYWLSSEIEIPKGWTTLILSLGVAELLILRMHFWRTGVEAALWIGGLFAFIFSLPSSGKPEAILVFVAASAIAGWRVRNALFGALALVLCTAYLITKGWPWTALAFSFVVTLAAALALTRVIRRPSNEALFEVAVIVLPIAGYVGVKGDSSADLRVVAVYAAVAVIILAVAIRFRSRVLLIATAVFVAIAGVEARTLVPLSNEMRLILAGIAVLTTASVLMRALRGKKSGFVIAVEGPSELQDILDVAPVLLPVHATAPSGGGVNPQGGEFGGAGASGNF